MNGPRRWTAFMAASVFLLCYGVNGDTSTPAPPATLSSTPAAALPASALPVGTIVSPVVPKTTVQPDPAKSTMPSFTEPGTFILKVVSTSVNAVLPVKSTGGTDTDMEKATSTQAAEISNDIIIKQTDMTMTEQKNPLQSAPVEEHTCVDKDAMKDRSVVRLTLNTKDTTCDQFKVWLDEIGPELCNSCKFNIFQEDDIVLAGGKDVEADPVGMAEKFSSENIKNKLKVVDAKPLWGKTTPTVLVSLLLLGLLLAALLIAGYCLKGRWMGRAKGKRLAEEPCQTHEDNECQSVSVTPLNPSEAQEKPTVNGESPDGGKNQPAPATTNGHSAAKSAVADTEL
ncbi:hematopoietic progenitor cell antigen CD34-like [Brienomyrus brachyistius]|uniref:hematopoietic progenitor cell antigen CD34-like n=1 Tax=Brienomyrus brachyistius TaxID=42636 RepID=UPI0020B3A955|nr:hematopoietic progenitor cell antigen CD34-like [Brienomyrus brachyistius]